MGRERVVLPDVEWYITIEMLFAVMRLRLPKYYFLDINHMQCLSVFIECVRGATFSIKTYHSQT